MIPNVHTNGVTAMALSGNQRFLVTGGGDGAVRVWEMRSRQMVTHLKEHSHAVQQIAIFNDNRHLVSCSRDKSFICWDLQAEKRVTSHTQRLGGFNGIAITPDQRYVLTAGQVGLITLASVLSILTCLAFATKHSPFSSCFVPYLFFTLPSQDRNLSVWDLRQDAPIGAVSAHNGEATCLALSHNGQFIGTGGQDGCVRLWSLPKLLARQESPLVAEGYMHSASIRSVAFATDDKQLVSTGADGAIGVWNVFL
jgi:WD40 repeat protein